MRDVSQKISASHLSRPAYLYVRQSSLKQVVNNTESTARQYDLRQRAVALGWSIDQVVVIDSDLGESGATAGTRDGFQSLVAEVGLGRAGIVMGLEVSRLARNSTDWHRLVQLCELSNTLILDEDGVYDPSEFNDRLLLGLKGTMSEAELHLIRSRLRGAVLNKARRGELKTSLPIGFVYRRDDQVILDPDSQIRDSIKTLFSTFKSTGSAMQTTKKFYELGLKFPIRIRKGPRRGDVIWEPLKHGQVLQILKNPRYAGAFCYGRKQHRFVQGQLKSVRTIPREDWISLIPDAHEGYISWEEFETNLSQLKKNNRARLADRKTPPREGPALLQGIAICGDCGRRMQVRYISRASGLFPQYMCHGPGSSCLPFRCLWLMGKDLDEAVGELLISSVTSVNLEVAIAVQAEIQQRLDAVDQLRSKAVERAQYEADIARRRFMEVDPTNRLVADELEAEWNQKLRLVRDAREELDRLSKSDRAALTQEKKGRILALAADFPRIWNSQATPNRERKRLVRLLIEDVTLRKGDRITAHVRFRGGATTTLTVPIGRAPDPEPIRIDPEVFAEIDRLLDDHTEGEIADIFKARGLKSARGLAYTGRLIQFLRRNHKLIRRFERLRARGLLTVKEVAERLGLTRSAVQMRKKKGLLIAVSYNDRGGCLYEPPTEATPRRWERSSKSAPRKASNNKLTERN